MVRRNLIKLYILLVFPLLYLLYQRDELRVPAFPALRSGSSAGLFRRDVRQVPFRNNWVAQNEGIITGPWVLDPPLPSHIPAGIYTLRFRCTWHADDLCPKRYIVLLRGPTIYAPPLSAITQDKNDPTVVTVDIEIADPGQYELYAWPDFDPCPKHWREKMTYPFNRGQVMGTPVIVDVTGEPRKADSMETCSLDNPELFSRSDGRWISKSALLPKYQKMPWVTSYPEGQEYIWQPYGCKRSHRSAPAVLDATTTVSEILFIGDSVLRGAFCSQVWPELAASGKADGECTFINDAVKYHVAPKTGSYTNARGKEIALLFRFMDDQPLFRIDTWKGVKEPSHVVANLGLWLAPLSEEEYVKTVQEFLQRLFELFPRATFIWRTTTDVAPMIQCFSDKGMTRKVIYRQRELSLGVVEQMKARGMRIYTVDGYAMTAPRPDAGNDGRHWVIESPEENNWLPRTRPAVNDGERAVMDAVWDVILEDDRMMATASRHPGLS